VSRIGSLALFVAWFVLLRPSVLGGPAQYVVVTGGSMEPGMQGGDLVVSVTSPAYKVGDVVVYRIPSEQLPPLGGRQVVHRIVGGDPTSGYQLQGDNAPRPDFWTVALGDIAGRVVFMIPAAGRALLFLRSPLLVASLAAGFAFVFMVWPPSRAKPGSTVSGGDVSPDRYPGGGSSTRDALAAMVTRAVADVAVIASHNEAQVARARADATSAREGRQAALQTELALEQERLDRELAVAEIKIRDFESQLALLEAKGLAVVGQGSRPVTPATRRQIGIAIQPAPRTAAPIAMRIVASPATWLPLSLPA
jgi:signal peptidase I